MMKDFEVVRSHVWRHIATGFEVSPYGAAPYRNESERAQWRLIFQGYTVYNPRRNAYGIGRPPWKNKAEAQAWADKENDRLQACRERFA